MGKQWNIPKIDKSITTPLKNTTIQYTSLLPKGSSLPGTTNPFFGSNAQNLLDSGFKKYKKKTLQLVGK